MFIYHIHIYIVRFQELNMYTMSIIFISSIYLHRLLFENTYLIFNNGLINENNGEQNYNL